MKKLALLFCLLLIFSLNVNAEVLLNEVCSKVESDFDYLLLKNYLGLDYIDGDKYKIGFGLNLYQKWDDKLTSDIEIDELYIENNLNEYIGFIGGKRRLEWGPGYYSGMVFSKSSPSIGMVGYDLTYMGYKYQRIYGVLDRVGETYLQGHRLKKKLIPNLEVGISETAIMNNKNHIDPLFYNPIPLWPIYLSQEIIIEYDPEQVLQQANINISGDINYIINGKSNIYGEIYIDDAPMTSKDNEPWLWGIITGYYNSEIYKNSDIRIEYARTSNYLYSHRNKDLNYTLNNRIIGHFIGPDSDLLKIESNIDVSSNESLSFGVSYQRKGEGNLDIDWGDEPDYKNKLFLPGIIEKTIGLKFSFKNQVNSKDNYIIEVELLKTLNKDNKPNRVNNDIVLSVEKNWEI
ncbi:MAG: capsule assembly Wzi family protein [bacterium]